MGRRGVTVAVALIAALAAVATSDPAPARAGFGFGSLSSSFAAAGEDAPTVLPAGSHPESWTTRVVFNTYGPPGEELPDGALKDLRIGLPAGLVGSAALLPKCSRPDFHVEACPAATRVGSARLAIAAEPEPLEVPLFLLDPLPGAGAQMGLHLRGIPVTLDLSIAPGPPYNLVATIADASQADGFFGATLTLDGVVAGHPFLTLPRSCPSPLLTRFAATSWALPGSPVFADAPEPQEVAACDSLTYGPELRVKPTTTAAAMPSGLDLDLEAPDPGIASAAGRAAADTRSATLRLPPGMVLNPAAAAGLDGCTPAELKGEKPDADPRTGCPPAAKLGSAFAETPLFAGSISGEIFAATPEDPSVPGAENPFGSLLALYLVLRDPERGVLLGLPIRVDADPRTGRLTAAMDEIPQLPLSRLSLRFNSGPRAPLTAPPGCGGHAIDYSLAPSSGAPPLEEEVPFMTTSGCDPGFRPEIAVGTDDRTGAGFVAELGNPGGGSNLSDLDLTLPPGLTADFTAVATCPEADAAVGRCGAVSRLGYARVALGSGPEPLWAPAGADPESDVFLAGPYRGAPFSLLVSLAAAAGPFDLGRMVLRAPLRIDPDTARVSVELDDLPQILAGVPLHYRTIRLILDRPGFIRNPTSCAPLRTRLTATAADGSTATATSPFRAGGCARLPFRPRLSLRLSGALGRNGHPSLHLRLAARSGGAGLSAATLALPTGELLDTHHLRVLCPREVPPDRCPAASRLGQARLRSPLLRGPLRGPVFLRAPTGRHPEIAAALRAGAMRVFLHGRVSSAPGARLRIRLGGLPDIPLSSAALDLAGGRRGIVVNSSSLCSGHRRASARLFAHNGKRLRLRPRLQLGAGC